MKFSPKYIFIYIYLYNMYIYIIIHIPHITDSDVVYPELSNPGQFGWPIVQMEDTPVPSQGLLMRCRKPCGTSAPLLFHFSLWRWWSFRESEKAKQNWHTLWLFNIAMENCPFIDDFPIKTSIYKGFSMAMLNNQRVRTRMHRESWGDLRCHSDDFEGMLTDIAMFALQKEG